MKKKAFTLIELIAVLVILAILALIVTPLVMNIIRKARVAADKRSIDAYGRSIEFAIANYLLDNGKFPTDISELTIEYSGDEVVCSTTSLNGDSSVYLSGCSVAGRSLDYTYGTDKTPVAPTYTYYSIGDEVRYNNVDYYVIKDSGTDEASVTLLKKTPLTVNEVNTYGGVGTENNHVNVYNDSSDRTYYQTAYDQNGYGGVEYYSSETCKYVTTQISPSSSYTTNVDSGCKTDYADSEIKYIVDAWASAKTISSDLVEDETGYSARLLTYNELLYNLGYNEATWDASYWQLNAESTPLWVYNSFYWTMSPYLGSAVGIWTVAGAGWLSYSLVDYPYSPATVRPVITIKKSALSSN